MHKFPVLDATVEVISLVQNELYCLHLIEPLCFIMFCFASGILLEIEKLGIYRLFFSLRGTYILGKK